MGAVRAQLGFSTPLTCARPLTATAAASLGVTIITSASTTTVWEFTGFSGTAYACAYVTFAAWVSTAICSAADNATSTGAISANASAASAVTELSGPGLCIRAGRDAQRAVDPWRA